MDLVTSQPSIQIRPELGDRPLRPQKPAPQLGKKPGSHPSLAVDLDLFRVNPLLALVRHGPLVFKVPMSREAFHQFVLTNTDLKIERDKSGTITIHPPMTLNSGFDDGEVFFNLKLWSKKNASLGKVFSPSTSFDLPDGSEYKADGAWISTEKLDRLSPEEKNSIALIVPDFVIEVRSKTDRLQALKNKMTKVWMANGVRLAWLIDPIKKRAWIYRAGAGWPEEILDPTAPLSGEEVVPGFEFCVGELA